MKKKENRKIFGIAVSFLFITLFAAGCRSTKAISNKGDSSLVILVIDENNRAVKDFSLVLENKKRCGKGTTNAQGMCSFNGIAKKDFLLNGQKSGYTKLSSVPVKMEQNGEVQCFSVLSEAGVFERVLNYYEQGRFVEGLTLLDTLCVFPDSWSFSAMCLYKAVGLIKTDKKREGLIIREQIKKTLKLPYELSGKIENEAPLAFSGHFLNQTEKTIQSFTVVFNVCNEDGESIVAQKDNVIYECKHKVQPLSSCDFSFYLTDYLQDEALPVKKASYEYLYVSQITCEDGTIWLDPFGLEALQEEK